MTNTLWEISRRDSQGHKFPGHARTGDRQRGPKGLVALGLGICALALATSAAAQATLPNLRALLTSIPDGSWVKLNVNNFLDVATPVDLQVPPYTGDTKPGSIIAAWSSFAWDSKRGKLILWGGGHANYGGNEVYLFDGASRLWQRGSVPSDMKVITGITYEAVDGAANAPVSAHTYDNQVYLTRADRFLTFGGASFNDGGPQQTQLSNGTIRTTGPFLWDPSKADPNKVGGTTGSQVQSATPHPEITGGQMWQNVDIYNGRFPASDLPGTFIQCVSDSLVENGVDTVYISGRLGGGTDQDLFRLTMPDVNDRSRDTWARVGIGWYGIANKGAGIYDPVRHAFIRTGSGNYVGYWDISTAGASNKDVYVTLPGTGYTFTEDYGMDMQATTGDLFYWGGGGAVWMVRPPTPIAATGWTVTKQPNPVGPVPSTNIGTGVLGKFKYISNLDAFMVLEQSGDVWLYRPAGWSGGTTTNQPPTVSITSPANGSTATAPASITITANASDSDGVVTKVEFYSGATLLASDTASPYTFAWNSVAAGTYTLTAVATDDDGARTTSSPVTVTVTASTGGLTNVAAASNGAIATASSTYPGYPPSAAIDGDRNGLNLRYWNSAWYGLFPEWVQVNFAGTKTISEIDVFSLQDNYTSPAAPTLAMTFSLYGLTDYQVQYWTGSAWAVVPGGLVSGNRNVWRQLTFAPITTDRIRVYVNKAVDGYSRLVEVEAWTSTSSPPPNVPPTVALTSPANGTTIPGPTSLVVSANASDVDGSVSRVDFFAGSTLIGSDTTAPFSITWNNVAPGSYSLTAKATDNAGATTVSAPVSLTVTGASVNVALATNGGVASASSSYSSGYPPSGANNGDRSGANWGNGGYWNDSTLAMFPDWLQITFNGVKTINRIDVFSVQDNWTAPTTPTATMTFSLYGLTNFDVQAWNGSAWVTVPGGSVTGNNLVWRSIVFPSLTTDRIRVFVNAAKDYWSRITEVEAWTP